MKTLLLMLFSVSLFLFAGCGASSSRPDWTLTSPDSDQGLYFLGISATTASEQDAEGNAIENAHKKIVQYLGTAVKNKMEKITVSHNLSSEVLDPVKSQRIFERQVSENVANMVKVEKRYLEESKRGWKYFVLAYISKKSLQDSFEQGVQRALETAKEKSGNSPEQRKITQISENEKLHGGKISDFAN